MANAVEFVDVDDLPLGLPPNEIYLGTVYTWASTSLEIRYISGEKNICIGPYRFEIFEILLLMDAIKQGMDQILLDHETARHLLHHSEGQA